MKHINLLIIFITVFVFSCQTKPTENKAEVVQNKLKVAVFGGNGASATCIFETVEALKIDTGIAASVIQAHQIQNGELSGFDVLVFPGGSGSKELNNLGKSNVEKIHSFVKADGKGIVGICAGGYLMSTTEGYPSLKMVSAANTDRAHYNRGRGLVEIALNDKGEQIFPELKDKNLFLQYYDGPVLVPLDGEQKYTELAVYKSDIHPDDKAPSGITPEKTFILEEKSGNGKVLIVAGHPESTPGMRWMVPRMVRQSIDAELISYNKKWVRPEINDEEIIFDSELKKYEKENFWKLFDENPALQIEAMTELHKLRSRPAVRYNIGLLRDISPEVRKHAAFLLQQTEYTYALPDLQQALKLETNEEVKKQLEETIRFLQ